MLSSHTIRSLILMHFQFRVTVAVPPSNDIDIFADDVDFIAIMDEKGGAAGINVTTGDETWKREDVPGQQMTSVSAQYLEQGKRRGRRLCWSNEIMTIAWSTFSIETVCRVGFPDASSRKNARI